MIRVVGMGPGNIRYVTRSAVEAIEASRRIVAFGRIAKTARQIAPEVIEVASVTEIRQHLKPDIDTSILASGDPCFFGIVEYLRKSGITVEEVVPGLSSFQYLMCRLAKSWQDACFLSLHGREGAIEKILDRRLSILLTDRNHPPDSISKRLGSLGAKGRIWVGIDLSYPEEKIVRYRIGESIRESGGIALMVIEMDF